MQMNSDIFWITNVNPEAYFVIIQTNNNLCKIQEKDLVKMALDIKR